LVFLIQISGLLVSQQQVLGLLWQGEAQQQQELA
jgi:hypothetical protein